MVPWTLPPDLVLLILQLAGPLHARVAWRLRPLLAGMLFAQGRRTVSSWLRAGALSQDFRRYYYFLGCLGRNSKWVASQLCRLVARFLDARGNVGERILLAIDDTPTKRYGPHVEGAGIHHNPTPGPAEQKFLYGHNWVTLSWCVHHAIWGTIGLPLRALMYVRQKQLPPLNTLYKVKFRTKLELAAELLEWAADCLRFLGKSLWVVADGAYAKREFLKRAKAAGFTVVSRLRHDAALRELPVTPKPGRRGRKPKYGKKAISLAKRAGQKRGWQTGEFTMYGKKELKTYKTFLASYAVADGNIRVVLVKEAKGWVAFFSTDPDATVAQILESYADRSAIEQDYHDIKEVHGAGQQQLRNYHANVAAFNLCLWLHTLIELWAWGRTHKQLCDRRQSPWDDAERRPSHADRRNALRRQCVREELKASPGSSRNPAKMSRLLDRLVKLVA
jgi:hypothetical protein